MVRPSMHGKYCKKEVTVSKSCPLYNCSMVYYPNL